MAESSPEHVFNHDIVFLHDMLNRFIVELLKSQSSGVSGMIIADQSRLESYIQSLRVAHDWIQAQPMLDLPETHPRPYPLEPAPEVPERGVENEGINQMVRLMVALRTELVNSQSARFSTRLQPFDSTRFVAIVDKAEAFLNNYIRQTTPIDMPESSPREAMTTDGMMGV